MQRDDLLVHGGVFHPRGKRNRLDRGCREKVVHTPPVVWRLEVTTPDQDHIAPCDFQATLSTEQPANPMSPKGLYLDTQRVQAPDCLQSNWGRIQRKSEVDYEKFLMVLIQFNKPSKPQDSSIIEELEGFVDHIDDETAYVTLTSSDGEVLYGEYPAQDLLAQGIHEHRRFKCRTIDLGQTVKIELEAVPDRVVSQVREKEMADELNKLLGDDDAPQDDY